MSDPSPLPAEPELNEDALIEADMAYMNSQNEGETKANCVKSAIKAYLNALSNPHTINLFREED